MRKLAVATLLLALVANTRSVTATPPQPAIVFNRVATARYAAPPLSSRVMFVLIIGSDVREGDPRAGRSDSLHVLALDTKTGRGTLIGIPRDSYVNIPGHGTQKINAALDFGGPELVLKTVSALSGLPFRYWALVDFSRFRKLVDRLGGIDVNVPYKLADLFSGAYFDPGVRHMNGEQALAFSRARKTLPRGDFDRSENQGRVLLGALAKFRKETASPVRLFAYFDAFRALVQSNVPTGELIALAQIARQTDPRRVRNVVLPGGGGNAGGASVVFLAPGARGMFDAVRDDGVL